VFSSLTIFLIHRNAKFSETIKNKEEEAKRLLKELKEQKEKSNLNQKDENKDYQEETDDLPWLFAWIGAIIDSIISVIIAHIAVNCNQKPKKDKDNSTEMFLTTLLYTVVFPPIFALKKYKNKSYWERLKLIEKNFLAFIMFGIIFFMLVMFLICHRNQNEKK
jgi:membrane protease YdiL (CAAX protease family)